MIIRKIQATSICNDIYKLATAYASTEQPKFGGLFAGTQRLSTQRKVQFRPCIDIHKGKVKQIVGSTLKDSKLGDSSLAAKLEYEIAAEKHLKCKGDGLTSGYVLEDGLTGGHVVMLGSDPLGKAAAIEALNAYPGGLQVGGSINSGNAIDEGTSHAILNSILVYEFIPNNSLHDLLHGRCRVLPDFERRLQIALGAARAILYLHTEADPPIIHRDIKSMNILLDSNWMAKVSDFGISKLGPALDARGVRMSHVSTMVKGTPGYVDPQYWRTNKLTEKSDVYSLGVVFLELSTGMEPISHGRNIVQVVRTAWESGMITSITERMFGTYDADRGKRFMGLALRCCLEDTKDRPSMLEVVRELENISASLMLVPVSSSSSTSE